jgi:VanZ family protein
MPDVEPGALTRALRRAGRFLLEVPLPLALVLVLLWGLLIFDLSSHAIPFPTAKNLVWEFVSNLAHAPLFGTLALFVAAVALRERGGGWPKPSTLRDAGVFGPVLLYGILDEWHQSHTPGRDASALDVLTDLTSALLVLWIVRTLGEAELSERRLLRRLATGVVVCLGCAAVALLS